MILQTRRWQLEGRVRCILWDTLPRHVTPRATTQTHYIYLEITNSRPILYINFSLEPMLCRLFPSTRSFLPASVKPLPQRTKRKTPFRVTPTTTFPATRENPARVLTKRMASNGQQFPPQTQERQPGKEYIMDPTPQFANPEYKPANKLQVLRLCSNLILFIYCLRFFLKDYKIVVCYVIIPVKLDGFIYYNTGRG